MGIVSMQEHLWSILRNRKRFRRLRVRAERAKGRRIFAEMLLQSIDPVLVVGMIG